MAGFGSKGTTKIAGKRVIVGIGDMNVSDEILLTLSSFALGSCVGIIAYDSTKKVGGVLHVMLPDSTISKEKANLQPHMFADTGMDSFREALQAKGVSNCNLKVYLAGGASVISSNDVFKIGEKNIRAVKEKIDSFGWNVVGEELGGLTNRSIHLNLSSGVLLVAVAEKKVEVKLS